ncbi:serum response factor b isoform X4 [Tachysurus fulvidraco]|uniref:serum response factor b isoform X4 n=1 Tax=Tachysurus fulvidraco TaxID=1234273 RepID=UPI001FEE63A6|nr:serum response factor b isoform X4 [Tachysurus fulvidraco]
MNRMLSSPAGSALSGNGSAGATGAAHGSVVLGGGLRTGLARAGQAVNTAGSFPGAAGRVGESVGMLGGSGPGISSRPGVRPGNGSGLTSLQAAAQPGVGGLGAMSARFDRDKEVGIPQVCSASDADSESGDEDEPTGSSGSSRRGVKRERAEMEGAGIGQEAGAPPVGYGVLTGGVAGAKPGKKTRGRVKIKMEFIDNKLRRYTTFSKRKTGIMKKAYELSTLTGTQVLLLVASETGHVYTFATRKLQPMITSETGKALIQTCLNSPDSPPRSDPSTDQRMSATGFEETDLTYQVSESESLGETKDTLKPAFTVASLPGSTSAQATVPTTSTTMQVSSSPSFPITNYLAPVSGSSGSTTANTNGTVLKSAAATGGVMQLPGGFTFMSAGTPFPPGTPTIPLGQLQQHSLALQGQQGQTLTTATVTASQTPQGQQAVFRLPAAVSLTGGTVPQQLQAIQVQPSAQSSSINTDSSSPEISQTSTASTDASGCCGLIGSPCVLFEAVNTTVSLPATIITSSVPTSVAGHMMYPSPHAVMYASAPTLTDGGLAVLNAFSQGTSAMQVSHAQASDTGAVPQVFLTAPPGTVQIPVSAVQIHPVRQDLHFTNGDWPAVQRQ